MLKVLEVSGAIQSLWLWCASVQCSSVSWYRGVGLQKLRQDSIDVDSGPYISDYQQFHPPFNFKQTSPIPILGTQSWLRLRMPGVVAKVCAEACITGTKPGCWALSLHQLVSAAFLCRFTQKCVSPPGKLNHNMLMLPWGGGCLPSTREPDSRHASTKLL